MRSSGWGLSQYDWYSYKKKKSGHRHVHKENAEMKMKAETTVMLLQAKEHQRLPANQQKLIKRYGTNLPGPWTPSLQTCETIHFCCLSHPLQRWQCFVMAVLGDKSTCFSSLPVPLPTPFWPTLGVLPWWTTDMWVLLSAPTSWEP